MNRGNCFKVRVCHETSIVFMGEPRLLAAEESFSWLEFGRISRKWRHLPAFEAISAFHTVCQLDDLKKHAYLGLKQVFLGLT